MTSVLFAIFVEAIDLSFLETSADTYATLLGPKRLSTLRLNVAQTMNALGLLTGILLGKYLVFQDSNLHTEMEKLRASDPEAARAFGTEQLGHTLQPYMVVMAIMLLFIVLFAVVEFPKCRPQT